MHDFPNEYLCRTQSDGTQYKNIYSLKQSNIIRSPWFTSISLFSVTAEIPILPLLKVVLRTTHPISLCLYRYDNTAAKKQECLEILEIKYQSRDAF